VLKCDQIHDDSEMTWSVCVCVPDSAILCSRWPGFVDMWFTLFDFHCFCSFGSYAKPSLLTVATSIKVLGFYSLPRHLKPKYLQVFAEFVVCRTFSVGALPEVSFFPTTFVFSDFYYLCSSVYQSTSVMRCNLCRFYADLCILFVHSLNAYIYKLRVRREVLYMYVFVHYMLWFINDTFIVDVH